MRDVIFVGSKDFVSENRETCRKHMRTVFDEIGLAYRVESAIDPVNFASGSPSKALFN
jgi:propanediol dehydratase large subunit